MRWSLITVTFNSADALERHWSGGLSDEVEWLVVDNASADRSVDVASSLGARSIPLDRNRGFAVANNVALREAKGTYVAFVNPDVRVDFESLQRLEQLIDKTGGLVAPQLVNPDGSLQPNARGVPFLVDKLAHRGLILPMARRDDYVLEFDDDVEAAPIVWAIGAAVMGRTDVVRSLGGWDERFFIYYEDHELGLRAWSRGVPVWIDRTVRWEHGWERATTRPSVEPWRREIASAARFYRKHLGLLLPTRGRRAREMARLRMPTSQGSVVTPAREV